MSVADSEESFKSVMSFITNKNFPIIEIKENHEKLAETQIVSLSTSSYHEEHKELC